MFRALALRQREWRNCGLCVCRQNLELRFWWETTKQLQRKGIELISFIITIKSDRKINTDERGRSENADCKQSRAYDQNIDNYYPTLLAE